MLLEYLLLYADQCARHHRVLLLLPRAIGSTVSIGRIGVAIASIVSAPAPQHGYTYYGYTYYGYTYYGACCSCSPMREASPLFISSTCHSRYRGVITR